MRKHIHKHHMLMLSLSKRLLRGLRRPLFLYLTTLSFTMIGLFSVGVYIVETSDNTQITNYWDALYYSVTIMTGVGLGDIVPKTLAGKLLSSVMMLLGTAIYVTFTASLATVLLETELQ